MHKNDNSQKYVVIKIGSNVVTQQGQINSARLSHIAEQVKQVVEKGMGICLVVSGAVTCGQGFTGKRISKQLAAGIGQAFLMAQLSVIFAQKRLILAQLLLTIDDLKKRKRRQDIKKLLIEAIEKKIVFVANENDVVDLHSFAGNDFLACEIAKLVGATYLLLLTDVEGIYGENMKVIREFSQSNKVPVAAINKLQTVSVGGIQAKILAAQEAADKGIDTFIASGKDTGNIQDIVLFGQHRGTKVVRGA
jgi:glutamate 5-kinase